MTTSPWSFATATELSDALAQKKVSSVELTEHAIARIQRHDAKINAVCVRDFERALASARSADAARARGENKPLLGIPVTVKESFNIAGLPTTWGIPAQKDFHPAEDALAITRVKDAGGVILGKTNVPLGLGDWQSYNDIYGTTNNPYDLTRTPGGSSGGSGAALAAGFGALSLGSDLGGSLRVPAFHCGIYAHKPTLTLVPTRGHTPPPLPALPIDRDLGVIGPMARSAADLSLLLDVMAGPDPLEAGKAYSLSLPPPRHMSFEGFRVLVIDGHPLMPTDAVVRAAIEKLAADLGKSGATVARQSPLWPDLRVKLAFIHAAVVLVPGDRLPAGRICRRRQGRGGATDRREQPASRAAARNSTQPSRLADGRWRTRGLAGTMAHPVREFRCRGLSDLADPGFCA